MPLKQILDAGEPLLTKKSKDVTGILSKKTFDLVKDLVDTLQKSEMVGLSAPQIGVAKRMFVTHIRKTEFRPADITDELRVFINPVIVSQSRDEISLYEGCGSIANGTVYGPVTRAKSITVRAYNEKDEHFELNCNGLLARVILHEIDHLDGTFFLEKIDTMKKLAGQAWYEAHIQNNPTEQKRCIISMRSEKMLLKDTPLPAK